MKAKMIASKDLQKSRRIVGNKAKTGTAAAKAAAHRVERRRAKLQMLAVFKDVGAWDSLSFEDIALSGRDIS